MKVLEAESPVHLRDVPVVLFIDNLQQRLESPALASAITADVYADRVVGSSDTLRLPVHCLWLATGNNPFVSREIARRTVSIRLDAGVDHPDLRTGFRHPAKIAGPGCLTRVPTTNSLRILQVEFRIAVARHPNRSRRDPHHTAHGNKE